MQPGHIHTPEDGRGNRDVFLNGKIVMNAFYANTKRGVVRVIRQPLKIDKWNKRLLTKTLRGAVEVRMRRDSGSQEIGN